jgi:polyhydroxyalkanoate synthesis regulator phasin
MKTNTHTLKIKSSNINSSSPFAERELTLSEIDSMYQNGEINEDQARKMATKMLIQNNADGSVFQAVLTR